MPYSIEVRRKQRHSQWEPKNDYVYSNVEAANEEMAYSRLHSGKGLEFRVVRTEASVFDDIRSSFRAQPVRLADLPRPSGYELLAAITNHMTEGQPRGQRIRRGWPRA